MFINRGTEKFPIKHIEDIAVNICRGSFILFLVLLIFIIADRLAPFGDAVLGGDLGVADLDVARRTAEVVFVRS